MGEEVVGVIAGEVGVGEKVVVEVVDWVLDFFLPVEKLAGEKVEGCFLTLEGVGLGATSSVKALKSCFSNSGIGFPPIMKY